MSKGAQIRIMNINKKYGSQARELIALKDINLDIEPGEFVCLLGPSGCGKSTLLNIIAGFIQPTSGTIAVNGVPVSAPGQDRGMVFQEYALFPWMTVAENIHFGLKIQGLDKQERDSRVNRLLKILALEDFCHSFPKDLSGGMKQRVAIARTLAIDPPVLLMDEPFGALDALTRHSLQDELLNIWRTTGKTIVFVTHSIEEAIYLGTRVIVLTYRPGTLKQDCQIALDYPRNSSSTEFSNLRRDIADLVYAEQERFTRDELYLNAS